MKSWYVFTLFYFSLSCLFYHVFFCVFFFSFNLFFVLFRFFFCLVWVLFVMFFFSVVLLVLFYFCFVLFYLFRLLVFCRVFFFLKLFLPSPLSFYSDTMQIEIMYNPANSICYGTCETDRECEWLNENCSWRELFEFEFICSPQWTLLRLKSVYGQLLHFHSSLNWTNLTEELVGPTTKVAKLIWIVNVMFLFIIHICCQSCTWKDFENCKPEIVGSCLASLG